MSSEEKNPNYIEKFEMSITKRKEYMSPSNLEGDTIIFTKAPANSAIGFIRSSKKGSTGQELKERNSSEMRNATNIQLLQNHIVQNQFGGDKRVMPFNENTVEYTKPPQMKRFRGTPQSGTYIKKEELHQNNTPQIEELEDQVSPEARKFISHPIQQDEEEISDIRKSLKNLNISKKEFKNVKKVFKEDLKNPVESKDIVFESSMILSPIRTEYVESKMEEVREMSKTMEFAIEKQNEKGRVFESIKQLYEYKNEEFYYLEKSLLGDRKVLGHINPITLKFTPLAHENGDHILSSDELQRELQKKVLFVFIDNNNLEKMLIFTTKEEDLKNSKKLSKKLMILGQINPETLRFIPEVFPQEGFFDWESSLKNKRAMFGYLSKEDDSFIPEKIKNFDYELCPKLAEKMPVIGHIDIISRKFIPKAHKKNKGKIKNVIIAHIDPKYPEIPIVINPKAYDFELETKLKNLTVIHGKIESYTNFCRISKNLNNGNIYPNDRILKKKSVIGYIDPFTHTFCCKDKEMSRPSLTSYLIQTKVILSHIDSKYPEIGYLILPHIHDEEINSKLTSNKLRGLLGYIDPATLRFVPDIRGNEEDIKLLRRMIKKRTILGYIDPLSLKFVKDDIPIPTKNRIKQDEFDYRKIGRDEDQIVMLGFLDPNIPTICQILRPGVKDFEVDSELMKKRTFLGRINPETQEFRPLDLIEGVNGVKFEDVLSKKLEIMGYNIKELPLIYMESRNPNKHVFRYYSGPKTKDYTKSRIINECELEDIEDKENIQKLEESFKLKVNPVLESSNQFSPQKLELEDKSNCYIEKETVINKYEKIEVIMNNFNNREEHSNNIFEKVEEEEIPINNTNEYQGFGISKQTSSFHNPSENRLEEEEEEEEEYEIRNLSKRQRIVKNEVDVCLTDEDEGISTGSRMGENEAIKYRTIEPKLVSSPKLEKVEKVAELTPNKTTDFNTQDYNYIPPIQFQRNYRHFEHIHVEKEPEVKTVSMSENENIPIIADKRVEKLKQKKKKSLVFNKKRQPNRRFERKSEKSKSKSRTKSTKFLKNSPHKKLTPIVDKNNNRIPLSKRIYTQNPKTNAKQKLNNLKKMREIKRSNSSGRRPVTPVNRPHGRRKDLVYDPEDLKKSKSTSRLEKRSNSQIEMKKQLSQGPILIQKRVFRNDNKMNVQMSQSVTFIPKDKKYGSNRKFKNESEEKNRVIFSGKKSSGGSTIEKKQRGSAKGKNRSNVKPKIDTGLRRRKG